MSSDTPPSDKRTVFSWCCYDFANSAFTTLAVTFIYSTYFASEIAPDEDTGTALWGYAIAVSALIIAFVSPFLGALADQGAYRKPFLLAATAVAVVGSVALYFPVEGDVFAALAWFVVANTAFELGGVFYNAYLPDIAPAERIGRISGYGWSFGYVGGLLCLAVAMVTLVSPDTPWFGVSKDGMENVRATNLLVAVWFAVFSLPMFLWVRDRPVANRLSASAAITASMSQLRATFREVRRYRQIVRLLVARMIYNDGLVTIFSFASIYAMGTFEFTWDEIMVFGIVLNIAAGIGAFALGFLDDVLGGKRTIQITLVGLFLASLLAVVTHDRTGLWVAGVLIGLFVGPNQSASRSLMGRFVPADQTSEFFGLFAFSGKATAFLGPLLVAELTLAFDQRAGMAVVPVLTVIGFLVLWKVDEPEGIAAAAENRP